MVSIPCLSSGTRTPLLQELLPIEKDDEGKIHMKVLDDVRFVPLKGMYE